MNTQITYRLGQVLSALRIPAIALMGLTGCSTTDQKICDPYGSMALTSAEKSFKKHGIEIVDKPNVLKPEFK